MENILQDNRTDVTMNGSGQEDSKSLPNSPIDMQNSDGNREPCSQEKTRRYDHVVPNEIDQDIEMKVTDELKDFQVSEQKAKDVDSHMGTRIETTKALAVITPGDGSCFYHAISRYLRLNESKKEITILDLPTIVKKNVKEYEKKHQMFSHAEGRISKYMRHAINSFIYDNVNLLLRLFPLNNLFDDDVDVDVKTAREMLQSNAIESVSTDSEWAGTAQIFALSLMTWTPVCVWVKGIDQKYYILGTQTAIQLAEIERLFKEDFRLKAEFDVVMENVKTKNEKKNVIHLCLLYTSDAADECPAV